MTTGDSLSPPPTLLVFILNLVIYTSLWFFAISLSRRDLKRLSVVPRFVLVSCMFRIAWFVSEYAEWHKTSSCRDARNIFSFLGRTAQLLTFSAFASVLFFWWDVLLADHLLIDKTVTSQPYFSPRVMELLLNFWLYILLFVLFLYKVYSCDEVVRSRIGNAELVTLAFFFGLLAIGYAVISFSLLQRLQLRESNSSTQLQKRIFIISIICIIFFSIRTVVFLLHPLFGVLLEGTVRDILYPWFQASTNVIVITVLVRYIRKKVCFYPCDSRWKRSISRR